MTPQHMSPTRKTQAVMMIFLERGLLAFGFIHFPLFPIIRVILVIRV